MRIPTLNMFEKQIATIENQYENLSQLIEQGSSQKKLLKISDDPIVGAQIKAVEQYIGNLATYKQNNILALNATNIVEAAAKSAVNTVDQIKQLIISAKNDTLSDNDRAAIATQLQGLTHDLLNIANRQDGDGNYIFAGSNVNNQPFILQNGVYLDNASQSNTYINIGDNVSCVFDQSGYLLFDHLFTGNGTFSVAANPANAGSSSTSVGEVSDSANYIADNYTLTFVTNSAGELAYQVIGANSGQVIPQAPATTPANAPAYTPNESISFNGMNISITGVPQVGDNFQISPSMADNIFNQLNNLINDINQPQNNDPSLKAQFHQALSQSSQLINNFFDGLTGFESEIGQRSKSIKSQQDVLDQQEINYQTTLSSLSDANIAAVDTQFTQQKLIIQSTLSIYTQMQTVLASILKLSG